MSKPGVRPYHLLDARAMAAACRRIARDLRAEAAHGWEPVPLSSDPRDGRSVQTTISRAEAAERMDAQAARWEAEVRGEGWNRADRERIGLWPP